VEGCSSAIEHDGLQQLAERPRGDQPRNRLVLVQRLAGNVGQQSHEQVSEQQSERERDAENRKAKCSSLDHGCRHGAWSVASRLCA
jgi:hypothetical protein